jgi:hypothetical protein
MTRAPAGAADMVAAPKVPFSQRAQQRPRRRTTSRRVPLHQAATFATAIAMGLSAWPTVSSLTA